VLLLYWFIRSVCCLNVFVPQYAILMLVFLKRLVIFLILGLWNVKMAHFLEFSSFGSFVLVFCCSFLFRFVMSCGGEVIVIRYSEYCVPFYFPISRGEW